MLLSLQPLSERTRSYIMNLDIEADALMLKERLNICQEAIDIFRASNLLLKAGVQAGMSLYDIAILCCRNDNLGLVPSKLENLCSTAAELAHAAIENERWHHSAASRALEQQLSPCLQVQYLDRSALRSSHKYRSSGDLVVLGSLSLDDEDEDDEDVEEEMLGEFEPSTPPYMAQSSASDSSTDSNEFMQTEKEECEEWAAKLIANVDEEKATLPCRRGHRSSSVSSDDGSSDSALSSSPKGFWYVRPGSTPSALLDENSLSSSPRESLGSYMDQDIEPSPKPRKAVVSFADSLPTGPFLPPSTVSVSKQSSQFLDLPMVYSGMTRSKSYNVLHRSHSGLSSFGPKETVHDHKRQYSRDQNMYRTYFLNFTDLVITREVSAATLTSRLSVA
jgi:hypothetical protein